jgi:Uncharacterised nucleotidyltransferase
LSSDFLEALICAVLRGDEAVWPDGLSYDPAEVFLERARYHGVEALLHERLTRNQTWPESVRQTLHQHALAEGMWELRSQTVLKSVLEALARIEVRPILFKGAALAYSLYPKHMLRSRGDADMLILPRDRADVIDVLGSLGFARNVGVAGDFINYQGSYTLTASDGGLHSIDLHWKINNSELLSRLFSYPELLSRSTLLPRLCSEAVGAGAVDALLLACMHRATHKRNPYFVDGVPYYGADRLIWLYDIHLLAQSFTSAEWRGLAIGATEKGLCATVLDGLQSAARRFSTPCPDDIRDALSRTGEPVTIYFEAGALRQHIIDFLSIDGHANRLRYVRELVFPPAGYMHAKYSDADLEWLPWLYARRAIGGLKNRLGGDRRLQ